MISKGIVLIIVAGVTMGGSATYLILENDSNVSVEFPLSLNDPPDDLLFVTAQTWNSRGRPNGTVAGESEFSQYYECVDFLKVTLNQTSGGLDISMQWAGNIIVSEGVVYAIYIELTEISYSITYTEGDLICGSDVPERDVDWHDCFYAENSSLVSEFSVSGPYINFTLDVDIEPQAISYILAISGFGEYEYYMDFVELEVRPEEDEGGEMPSVFDEIYIRGDTDFTEDNGVSRGKGTADDPYIIENIIVNGKFNVEKTTKHLEIRNVKITGDGDMRLNGDNIIIRDLEIDSTEEYASNEIYSHMAGILISGNNIEIYGYEINAHNLSNGITIDYEVQDVYISEAKINGTINGISIWGAEGIIVERTNISYLIGYGFEIQNSKHITIRNSTISNNGHALWATNTESVSIEHCNILNNSQGMNIDSSESRVIYSNVNGNYLGFRLGHGSINVTIRYNNIEDNQAHLYWQASVDTRPDSYISNNYWNPSGDYGDTNPSSNRIPNTGPI